MVKEMYGELLTHGGDIYTKRNSKKPLVDFSANINPLGMPEGVKKAAAESISHCEAYPDPLCRSLRGAIAAFHRISPDWIVCGNGAADVIFRLVLALHPQKAAVITPTFSEYENALRSLGVPTRHVQLREEKGFRPGREILEEIDGSFSLLFFCNPNNPTGLGVEKEFVRELAETCRQKNCFLVVDECFSSFLEEEGRVSAMEYVESFPNLFLLKAFTKMYAMAGIRLGYGICRDTGLISRVMASGQPWSVSTVASFCGIAALAEEAFVRRTVAYVAAEREYLKENLAALGFVVYDSKANYVFFHDPFLGGENQLRDALEAEGVLIRSCANYPGLDGHYYRVAVKSHGDNIRLIQEIGDLLGGNRKIAGTPAQTREEK